jgi:hypothetical protein
MLLEKDVQQQVKLILPMGDAAVADGTSPPYRAALSQALATLVRLARPSMFMVPMKLVLVVLIGLYLHITSKALSPRPPGMQLLLPPHAATAAARSRRALGTSSVGTGTSSNTQHLHSFRAGAAGPVPAVLSCTMAATFCVPKALPCGAHLTRGRHGAGCAEHSYMTDGTTILYAAAHL